METYPGELVRVETTSEGGAVVFVVGAFARAHWDAGQALRDALEYARHFFWIWSEEATGADGRVIARWYGEAADILERQLATGAVQTS